jgi:ABC-type Na+ transport system ATPase subunit NatA
MCSRLILIADGEVRADQSPTDFAAQDQNGQIDEVFYRLTVRPDEAAT